MKIEQFIIHSVAFESQFLSFFCSLDCNFAAISNFFPFAFRINFCAISIINFIMTTGFFTRFLSIQLTPLLTTVRHFLPNSELSLTFQIDLFLVIVSFATAIASAAIDVGACIMWHCRIVFVCAQFKNEHKTEWQSERIYLEYFITFWNLRVRCAKRFFLTFLQYDKGNRRILLPE